MKFIFNTTGLPLQDLTIGASVYFPPVFKLIVAGSTLWLVVHRLLRDWIYSGETWHLLLMDLLLFTLCVCLAFVMLIAW